MNSRKKPINLGTVTRDKVGGGTIERTRVKHRGKTWTILCSIDEPPSDYEDDIDLDKLKADIRDAPKKMKELEDAAGSGEYKEKRLGEEFIDLPCESCLGEWHRPFLKEPPPPPVPIPEPGWYVVCGCCYSKQLEEKTADCACCGSADKCVLRKWCKQCFGGGHSDITDKECPFFGKTEMPVKKYPFRRPKPSGPGIKISHRQPLRTKLAMKQKEPRLC